VTVTHPEALRWGFQITARWAKDPTQNVGTFRPVNNQTQLLDGGYVTHTLPGTSGGEGGTKTFELEWTPPTGADDSDVIFYAAANAANANATDPSTGLAAIAFTPLRRASRRKPHALHEKPVITSIVDAASFNRGVSAASLITLQGRNLSTPNTRRDASLGYVRDNRFPMELGVWPSRSMQACASALRIFRAVERSSPCHHEPGRCCCPDNRQCRSA
jgi:hypothetical protein